MKSNFNFETPNLIYVISCNGCNREYIGQTGGQPKRDSAFTGSTFDNLNMKKIEVERHLRTCAKGIFKIFSFFKMKENNKMLRECYKDNFIKKFKTELNRRL